MKAQRVKKRKERPLVAMVDDDVFVCRAMERLLLTHEIRVETFTSARIFIDSIATLPSFRPECVIVDMHMPAFHEFDVHAQLAALRPGIPVVFLSGVRLRGYREFALAQGAVDLFYKPLDDEFERFLTALRNILGMNSET
jgi:FixJ family two-component response regulator